MELQLGSKNGNIWSIVSQKDFSAMLKRETVSPVSNVIAMPKALVLGLNQQSRCKVERSYPYFQI